MKPVSKSINQNSMGLYRKNGWATFLFTDIVHI